MAFTSAYETTQEIKALRQGGNPQEAFDLAQQALAEYPGDRYITNEMAWSIYALLSQAKGSDLDTIANLDEFIRLSEVAAAQIPADYKSDMFTENMAKLMQYTIRALSLAKPAREQDEEDHANNALLRWESHKDRAQKANALLCAVIALDGGSREYCTPLFIKYFTEALNLTGALRDSLGKDTLELSREVNAIRAQSIIEFFNWADPDTLPASYYEVKYFRGAQGIHRGNPDAQRLTNAYLRALVSRNNDGEPYVSKDAIKAGAEYVGKMLTTPKCKDWKHTKKLMAKLEASLK